MKLNIVVASALMAALAAPVMADSYGSGTMGTSGSTSATTGSGKTGPAAGSMGNTTSGGSVGTQPPGPKDTRDAMGRNVLCSDKDKLKDGTCKPGAKRVTDGSSGMEVPSGASGSNASGSN